MSSNKSESLIGNANNDRQNLHNSEGKMKQQNNEFIDSQENPNNDP